MNIFRSLSCLAVLLACALASGNAALSANKPALAIIDTDFGLPPIDDAFAVALALASPDVHLLGITTVGGNQKLAVENAELLAFLGSMGASRVPAYAGAPAPLDTAPAYRAFLEDSRRASYFAPGQRGPRAFASAGAYLGTGSAAAFIARTVRAHPGRVTLLCLGPLTNVADAIERDPRVAPAIGRLVIGGGYFRDAPAGGDPVDLPGSESRYAEFNFWVDPKAAAIVFRSGVPITLVPFNVNKQVTFTPGIYRSMLDGDSRFSQLLRRFAPVMPAYAGKPFPMFDEVAVTAFLAPALFESERMPVDIVTRYGPEFGESVTGTATAHPILVLRNPRAGAIRTFIAMRLATASGVSQ